MLDAIRSLIVWTPLGLPAFLFVITLVVFFHEMGHFLVARWFGVKVDVFSVGFGKEIFGWTDRLGTRWKISWLPIGGYVQICGRGQGSSPPRASGAPTIRAGGRQDTTAVQPRLPQRPRGARSSPSAYN